VCGSRHMQAGGRWPARLRVAGMVARYAVCARACHAVTQAAGGWHHVVAPQRRLRWMLFEKTVCRLANASPIRLKLHTADMSAGTAATSSGPVS
jgi:hypothetical protein